ncbi:MAG: tetratricopeptide repeat protein [candidate division Zixibacteria bacterium]|nr:tetratricopeptide repeat protein [candidate division Zixibacteria bacterium]
MDQLTLTSKLRGMGKEFFLQSSGDPSLGKGSCVLFEGGNPVDVIDFKLPENPKKAAGVIEEYHKIRLDRFNRLSGIFAELTDETDSSILEKLAISLIEQKLFDEAAQILERAVKQTAHNSRLLNCLGLTYMEIEEFEKAQNFFLKVIELNPEYPDYHNNLGKSLLKQGKCFQAYQSFEKAIQLNVYFAEAYYNMAMAVILNGIKKEDYNLAQNLEDNATNLLAKSVGFDPSFKNEHLQKGLDALENKDLETAFVELSKGFNATTDGKFPKKTYNFHLEYLFQNDLLGEKSVIRHINRLNKDLENHPNYPDLYNELGMAYTVLAQFHSDRAIEAFQKALQLNPDYKTAMKNLKLTQNEIKGLKTLLRAILK